MVKLTKIYTRTGDDGESGLVGGTRVKKSDPQFSAIGDVDEANAAIGFASAVLDKSSTAYEVLQQVQNDLFDLGADLATPAHIDGALRMTSDATVWLEQGIDSLGENLGPLTSFVLPGGKEGAARLHLARTIVRRAERSVASLAEAQPLNREILIYLNRLSDLLFQLARVQNQDGKLDILWKPGSA
ncbi:MAG: cob(I)yrinic acid a,c-diamide adenosyltransferase [Magnetovibrio sp.]|nr:cob(I)yrinic acid a,c-diamide adenosyltransferase [Magnetovibrio sp.]